MDPLVDQTGQPYAFVNDNPLNATDPLGLLGAGYPRANWAKELRAWQRGGASTYIGMVLGGISVGAAVVALGAEGLGATAVAGTIAFVTGIGATLIDGRKCKGGDLAACPGAILGLGGIAVGGAGFAPAGSGLALAAPGASLNLGVAASLVDALIAIVKLIKHSPAPRKATTVNRRR